MEDGDSTWYTAVTYATVTATEIATEIATTNATSIAEPNEKNQKMIPAILMLYTIGIIGNAVAFIMLRIGERRVRNRKHLLLLSSLTFNDLIALVGMMASMLVSELLPKVKKTRLFCGARVVLRIFGIGSVCIAVTMALERYLALSRPFLYQKRVTYNVIWGTLLVSWVLTAVLTCAPLFGIGLYYDESNGKCTRYRNAISSSDIAYGIFYVIFGIILCVILVICNFAVIQALWAITVPRNRGQLVVRRVSKSSCRQRQRSFNSSSGNNLSLHRNAATAEEVAFSRLMAILSGLFMCCWLPQMITSAIHLAVSSDSWKKFKILSNISDFLMLLNYIIDPIIYVLLRHYKSLSLSGLCHYLAHCFKRNHKTSTESIRSCCPETVMVSDSSGAELRPLKPLPPPQPYEN